MAGRDIVVVGASAGGVDALTKLVRGLPRDLPAAVFIILHVPPDSQSALPQILTRAGPLPAAHAGDGDRIQRGRIYVAPPDNHLLIRAGAVRVVRGPRENGHRPAVDPLFRTAAANYGRRVVGVVLSGALDDGTAGLAAIKSRGGTAVVQSPDDALVTGMPTSALENVDVDYSLRVADIGPLLSRLTSASELGDEAMARERGGHDFPEGVGMSDGQSIGPEAKTVGAASGFTCPECGGSLWESQEGEILQYRCHVGHGFSADSLLGEQSETLETALWTAYRALEERASLSRRLATRARERGHAITADRFEMQAEDAERRAEIVRGALSSGAEAREPPRPEAKQTAS